MVKVILATGTVPRSKTMIVFAQGVEVKWVVLGN